MSSSAIRFFYKHAGYSWNEVGGETRNQGRWRCARALADAERWGQEQGVTFTWQWDDSPDLSWCECAKDDGPEHDHEVLGCIARLDDNDASLWGIVDADRSYRRVIEAELAGEIMDAYVKREQFIEQETGEIA